MKKNTLLGKVLLMLVLTISSVSMMAQNEVISKTVELPSFDRISIGGAMKVEITQSATQQVVVEVDANLADQVGVKVVDGELRFSTGSFKKAEVLKAKVSLPTLSSIEATGASFVETTNQFNGNEISIEASGASHIIFEGAFDKVDVNSSGASKMTLKGNAKAMTAELSGASKLFADNFEVLSVNVEASGASTAYVNAKDNLEMSTSGASKIYHDESSQNIEKEVEIKSGANISVYETPSGDTVRVDLGSIDIEVIDGDSTKVKIGSRSITVDEDGNVKICKEKRKNFNGHWAGVEMGINGMLTPQFNLSFPKEESYLDLRYEKSINFNLNLWEQNIPLNRAKTMGLVSGLGISWNNYRFDNNVYPTSDSLYFKAFYSEGVSMRKSKLTLMYITVPLFFEMQTNADNNAERLHFSVGVIGGWRVSTHSKMYFEEANKEFTLRDPGTDETLPLIFRSPDASKRNITKNFDGFNMRPFKLDASVRMGWGFVSLYANYSIFSLWVKDQGPDVYPFAVGICLAGW